MHSFIHALINALVNLTGARENVRKRDAVKRATVIAQQDTTTFIFRLGRVKYNPVLQHQNWVFHTILCVIRIWSNSNIYHIIGHH